MNRWHSVDSCLPRRSQSVIVFDGHLAYAANFDRGEGGTGVYHGISGMPYFETEEGSLIRRVTHWMPMPEPPSEEERA